MSFPNIFCLHQLDVLLGIFSKPSKIRLKPGIFPLWYICYSFSGKYSSDGKFYTSTVPDRFKSWSILPMFHTKPSTIIVWKILFQANPARVDVLKSQH